MQTSTNNVTSINGSAMENEITKIKNSINSLPWKAFAHIVLDAAGLEVGPASWDRNTAVGIESLASEYKHKTIGSFVSGVDSQNGLGLEWPRWEKIASALFYSTKFQITAAEVDEIIAEYQKAYDFLGRNPVSEREYNAVKERIFQQSLDNASTETDHAKKRVNDLERTVSDQQQLVVKSEEKLQATVMERNDALHKLSQQSRTNETIQNQLLEVTENTRVLEQKLSGLEGELENERIKSAEKDDLIEGYKQQLVEYEGQLNDLQKEADELQARIDMLPEGSDDMIGTILQLKDELMKLTKRDAQAQVVLGKYHSTNKKLNNRVKNLKARVELKEDIIKQKDLAAKQDRQNLWVLGGALAICVTAVVGFLFVI